MKKTTESIDTHSPIQYLYKYMSLESFQKMITRSILLFSDPTEYNDPFDTKGFINCDSSLSEKVSFWINEGKSEEEALQISNAPNNLVEDITNQAYNGVRRCLRICCFSNLNDNILMWSHYANKHTGVCVKFSPEQDEIFGSAKRVTYKENLPVYHIFKNNSDEITDIIFSKSIDWKYEEEIRIVKHMIQNSKRKVGFNKQALTEVIFGCNFPESKIKGFKALMEKYGYKVIFKRAEIVPMQYKLKISDIG